MYDILAPTTAELPQEIQPDAQGCFTVLVEKVIDQKTEQIQLKGKVSYSYDENEHPVAASISFDQLFVPIDVKVKFEEIPEMEDSNDSTDSDHSTDPNHTTDAEGSLDLNYSDVDRNTNEMSKKEDKEIHHLFAVPKTFDPQRPAFWVLLVVVSLILLIIGGLWKKKN